MVMDNQSIEMADTAVQHTVAERSGRQFLPDHEHLIMREKSIRFHRGRSLPSNENAICSMQPPAKA